MPFGPFDLVTLTIDEARVLRDFILEHTRSKESPWAPDPKRTKKVEIVEIYRSLAAVIGDADWREDHR